MKNISLRFLKQLSIITVVLILILVGVTELMNVQMPTFTVSIFIVLYVVTFLVFLLQIKVMLSSPDYSMHVIIGSLIIRLIAFVLFNFIIIYTDRLNAVPNIVLFFSIYIVYTAVEMIALFRQINLPKIDT